MHKQRPNRAKAAASAPNKIILAGEHSVVWGGLALSAPVEVANRRNRASARLFDGAGKIIIRSKLGTTVLSGGKLSGSQSYGPIARAVLSGLGEKGAIGILKGKDLIIELEPCGAPKGTGNSASLSAAAICASLGLAKRKTCGRELFSLVMPAEDGYHANKASGIDPLTVCSDFAIVFKKRFGKSGAGFEARKNRLSLPKGTALLLADSSRGGAAAATGELINAFAKASGISSLPGGLSWAERKKVTAPFDSIVKSIVRELKPGGNAQRLGGLFDRNQELLRKAGVSSQSIEHVIRIAKKAGALGAKLTGAGGSGGSVLVLARKKDAKKIRAMLEARGFATYAIRFSQRGACRA